MELTHNLNRIHELSKLAGFDREHTTTIKTEDYSIVSKFVAKENENPVIVLEYSSVVGEPLSTITISRQVGYSFKDLKSFNTRQRKDSAAGLMIDSKDTTKLIDILDDVINRMKDWGFTRVTFSLFKENNQMEEAFENAGFVSIKDRYYDLEDIWSHISIFTKKIA